MSTCLDASYTRTLGGPGLPERSFVVKVHKPLIQLVLFTTSSTCLTVQVRGSRFRVSSALDFYPLEDFVDLGQLRICQSDFPDVFLNTYIRGGAGNGDDGREAVPAAMLPDPCESDLSKSCTLLLGDLLDLIRQLDVLVKDSWLEAGLNTAEVSFGDVLKFANLAGL